MVPKVPSGGWTDERFTVVNAGKGELSFHNPRYNRPSAALFFTVGWGSQTTP